MRGILKSWKIYLPIILATIVVVVAVVFFAFLKNRLFPSSTARIYLEGQILKVNFKIVSQDLPKIEQFSQNLGISSSWTQGITVTLDEASIAKLQPYLPQEVNLSVGERKLLLQNTNPPTTLVSSLPKQNQEIATGGGRLKLNAFASQGYEIEISSPSGLLNEATRTGSLKLSKKLDDWLGLVDKIANIKVRMSQNFLSVDLNLR
ncbi:hypothetical protein HY389_00630 [Candidatus Daviesbacteria bacterium]|nr:hypothetical protein [Candidatus Daviesbacteria bacterium]